MEGKRGWANKPFKGLRRALDRSSAGRRVEKQAPAAPEHCSDEDMFLEAMSDVREIPGFRELHPVRGPKEYKGGPLPDDEGVELRRILDPKTGIYLPDIDEYDEWVSRGEAPDLPSRLHSGECSVQDFIDLHGLTEDEAVAELAVFLEESRRRGLGCVKVIHGRGLRSPGRPVLKSAVSRLLKGSLSRHVRAYSTAHPGDGGLGATYVLLRGR